MKITIQKSNLSKALQNTQNIVYGSGLPVVSLEAFDDNYLHVTAFDNDVIYQGTFECTTHNPGDICISGRSLYEYVKELPDEEVNLETLENHRLKLSCGKKIKSIFAGLDRLSFPEIPDVGTIDFIHVDKVSFLDMINKTIFSVSNDETRPWCTGCYFEVADDKECIRMVSTDGHRMSLAEQMLPKNGDQVMKEGIILSKKAISEFKKLSSSSSEVFEFATDETNAYFKIDNSILIAKLISGKFPNYKVVIPDSPEHFINISKVELQSSIRRISTTSDVNRNMRFYFSGNELTLKSSNPDLGEASELLLLDKEIPEMVLGCNAKYLLDALAVVSEDMVTIKFINDRSPLILEPVQDNPSCFFVIMPVRVVG